MLVWYSMTEVIANDNVSRVWAVHTFNYMPQTGSAWHGSVLTFDQVVRAMAEKASV